ncbi:MAG: electron transport complex subunit RsxC [Oscillospiraceae bacterium]
MKRLFFGGIHPLGNKDCSRQAPAISAPPPKQVVLPMCQHIGAPCVPTVAVGERVLLGQVVGRGEGLCAPIHASVSGKVSAVEPRPNSRGGLCLSVVIENDLQDEKAPARATAWQTADAEALIEAICEAGIVGMGGATFPTAAKLRAGLFKTDCVIINACECEPYITADDCLISMEPNRVLKGAAMLGKILEAKRIVLAVEDNKPQGIKALSDLESKGKIEILPLPTLYPQGAEKQLIQSVTGRQVPPGGLPAAVGCGVFNAATCAAICRALEEGTPLYERLVTVSGEGVAKPQNFIARLGTSFEELIEAAGGLLPGCERVLSGGPMMGLAQTRLDVPVMKGTNAILCLKGEQIALGEQSDCIRCGRCVAACPMKLEPLYLHQFYTQKRQKQLQRAHLTDCIECGCCAYVCPAKLPLVEEFRAAKAQLKAEKKEGVK